MTSRYTASLDPSPSQKGELACPQISLSPNDATEREFCRATIRWYRFSFKAFWMRVEFQTGDSRKDRDLGDNNLPISINAYFRCLAWFCLAWFYPRSALSVMLKSPLSRSFWGAESEDGSADVCGWCCACRARRFPVSDAPPASRESAGPVFGTPAMTHQSVVQTFSGNLLQQESVK